VLLHCLVTLFRCFIVFLRHIALLFHSVASLPRHPTLLLCCIAPLPHCLLAIAPQVPSNPPPTFLFHCLVALLPCVGSYFLPPLSFVGRNLELKEASFPTTTREG
jgi:hypothetical protein